MAFFGVFFVLAFDFDAYCISFSIRYAAAAIAQARSRSDFPFELGIHAAAEAMIGQAFPFTLTFTHRSTGQIIVPIPISL